jgi:hypothetical protein
VSPEHSWPLPPLLPIQIHNIIPPTFHIIHGIGQRLLDLVEAAVIEAGNEEELGRWLKEAKCKRRKRAQNYTGFKI